MEQYQTPEASQNCFLPTGTDRQEIRTVGNEIYLYDDAEPLAYVCSDTSMPPTSAGCLRTASTAGKPKPLMSEKSLNDSKTYLTKCEKSMVYKSSGWHEESIIQSPQSAEGKVSDFKSAIMNKFKEFTTTSNSSCLVLKDRADSVDLSSEQHDLSRISRNRSRNDSEDILKAVYLCKSKFISSSSESDRLRITSDDHQDEVFSTGVSDMEEGATRGNNMMSANLPTIQESVKSRHQQHGIQKSTAMAKSEANPQRSGGTSPDRISPPVQKKLSLRALRTSPPCFSLLEEIRRNNLVMDEDIFSSGENKTDQLHDTFIQNVANYEYNHSIEDVMKQVNVRKRPREWELLYGSPNMPGNSGRIAAVKTNNLQQQSRSNAIEIYEAIGGEKSVENPKNYIEEAEKGRQIPGARDFKALTANIRFVRNQFEEPWRPFKTPQLPERAIEPSIKIEVISSNTNLVKRITSDPTFQSNAQNSDRTSERHANHQLDDYRRAKVSTPNRRNEKYVKLHGLVDAFHQHDSNFKGLRIKNGTSFESVNAFEELSMGNQVMDLNRREIRGAEELVTNRKPETKDAATDVSISFKNTKTQTGFDKTLVDSYMQCESHIVDEVNGRNVIKNDHQEILVCNDNGDGIQLYNELGHPLTDMDGYLLKDSLGRLLVRLDDYGVPISCTNGQGIFMEDSRAWSTVKNTMNIIHQCKKKQIMKRRTAGKACLSVRQVENAMKNLRNTLEWAENISLNSVHENTTQRFTEHPIPLRSIKPCMDSGKILTSHNTSSLIAEMKSISRLRNALLEKVNFIVDNRQKLEKSRKMPKCLRTKIFPARLQDSLKTIQLNNPISLLQSQDRPRSPTYKAVKMLKQSQANSEVDVISNVDNLAETSMSETCDNIKPDLWKTSVRGRKLAGTMHGNMLSTGRPSGGKLKATDDLWMDSLVNKSDDSRALEAEKLTGNKTDLWRMIGSSDDDFLTLSKKYAHLYGDTAMSDMKFVSRDKGNLGGASVPGKGNSNESGLKESQLLCTLEKEYNLRIDDSWTQPWNENQ